MSEYIDKPIPVTQVPRDFIPDLNPQSVDEKIAVFEQRLAEPPQRLGFCLDSEFTVEIKDGWNTASVMHRLSAMGIVLTDHSKTP